MQKNPEEIIEQVLSNLSHSKAIKLEKIPDLPLYMDQVTSFMETALGSFRRDPEDKILTKTMINNYTKNKLLPPPFKKKYSREHVLLLIFVYYFKSVLSISDIKTLLSSLTDSYLFPKEGIDIDQIYAEIYDLERQEEGDLRQQMESMYQKSRETFAEVPDSQQEFLQVFSFICLLCYDIYVKRQLVEQLIDQLFE